MKIQESKIVALLSDFSQNDPKKYRREIKSNYIANNLFYAKSVEITLTKEAGVDIGVTFDESNFRSGNWHRY